MHMPLRIQKCFTARLLTSPGRAGEGWHVLRKRVKKVIQQYGAEAEEHDLAQGSSVYFFVLLLRAAAGINLSSLTLSAPRRYRKKEYRAVRERQSEAPDSLATGVSSTKARLPSLAPCPPASSRICKTSYSYRFYGEEGGAYQPIMFAGAAPLHLKGDTEAAC